MRRRQQASPTTDFANTSPTFLPTMMIRLSSFSSMPRDISRLLI